MNSSNVQDTCQYTADVYRLTIKTGNRIFKGITRNSPKMKYLTVTLIKKMCTKSL